MKRNKLNFMNTLSFEPFTYISLFLNGIPLYFELFYIYLSLFILME